MKKANKLISGLINGFFVLSSLPALSTDRDDREQIESLRCGIHKVHDQIRLAAKNYQEVENAIIFIGPVGSAKSTVINHLAGKNLIAEKIGNRKYRINVQDPLPNINVGHGMSAGTRIPGAWFDQHNKIRKVVYWDCPGFCDPRGSENEIINAFAIGELFALYPQTKIVIAMEEGMFSLNRADPFLKILSKLTKTFPDYNLLKNSLSLLVTKLDRFDCNSDLKRIWEENRSCTDIVELKDWKVRDLFFHLAFDGYNQVTFFPYPEKEGSFEGNRDNILATINRSTYMYNPKVVIDLYSDQKLLLTNFANNLNNGLMHKLRHSVSTSLERYCESIVDQHPEKNIETIKLELSQIKNNLINIRINNVKNFRKDICKIFTQTQIEEIKYKIEELKFCVDLGLGNYQLQAWKDQLSRITNRINDLSNPLIIREEQIGDYIA